MLGVSLSMTVANSSEGFFLWDAGRGLVTAMESVQSAHVSAAAAEFASFTATVNRRIRMRLVD